MVDLIKLNLYIINIILKQPLYEREKQATTFFYISKYNISKAQHSSSTLNTQHVFIEL